MTMQYRPAQGDIILLHFNPQAGHEQRGQRPALVVSNDVFNRFTKIAMVCPITNTDKGFPLHVRLDSYFAQRVFPFALIARKYCI